MWEKPVHHSRDIKKTHEVHWIELCYDLIHVVAIFLLGHHLVENLSLFGFLSFVFLFITFWISWGDYAFYNSLYVSRDYKHRIISAFHVVTVMFMAASVPLILETGPVYFMLSCAVNRIVTAFLYYRACHHNLHTHTLASEMFRNFSVVSVVFLVAAFLPDFWNYTLFFAGLLMIQISYLLPRFGVMRFETFTPRISHLSERFSLLLLICLGEGYFKMVLALSEKDLGVINPTILFNYLFGGVILFLLAWVYFDARRDGNLKDTKKKTMASWWYGHMGIMLSALMISIALRAEVKVPFFEPYPLLYACLGCSGLIGYLLCLELIQSSLRDQKAYRFVNLKVKLIGILLASIAFVTVLLELPSLIGNLFYGSAVVSQLLIPITHAYRVYRPEIEEMHAQREKK